MNGENKQPLQVHIGEPSTTWAAALSMPGIAPSAAG
jgi:hypothetical protein